MSEGLATSEITVQSHSQADVEALVQAAVSVLTNDMQVCFADYVSKFKQIAVLWLYYLICSFCFVISNRALRSFVYGDV